MRLDPGATAPGSDTTDPRNHTNKHEVGFVRDISCDFVGRNCRSLSTRLKMAEHAYKLKIIRLDSGEIEVVGNRAGLKELAEICHGLSELSDEDAKTAANHYHFADYMNNAEEGSLQLTVLFDPNL